MITIRHSAAQNIDEIMAVYESAIRFMRRSGNHSQWTGGYPSADVILRDIAAGNHFTGRDSRGRIVVVFSFIVGNDPTYAYIEGRWLNNEPYGTVHRVASSGLTSGTLEHVVNFCFGRTDNIRIDTHADNRPMQSALARLGFTPCGTIYLADGSPRLAFQLTAE